MPTLWARRLRACESGFVVDMCVREREGKWGLYLMAFSGTEAGTFQTGSA